MSRRKIKTKRVMAFILCLCMVATVMFCSQYLALHTSHSCLGLNCPECVRMYHAVNALRQFAIALLALAATLHLFTAWRRQISPLYGYISFAASLVRLKVKLNH